MHLVKASTAMTRPLTRLGRTFKVIVRACLTTNGDALVPVPAGDVTETGPAPAPAGTTAVAVVGLVTENVAAGVPAKAIAVAPVRFVPVIVTVSPTRPVSGATVVIVGGGLISKFVSLLAMPVGVITLIGPDTAPVGTVAVICDGELTVKAEAAMPPKLTDVAPVRFVPVITTCVPAGLVVGANEVIVGPFVVMSNDQPPAIAPLSSPAKSSKTYSDHVPFGTVPLKIVRAAP